MRVGASHPEQRGELCHPGSSVGLLPSQLGFAGVDGPSGLRQAGAGAAGVGAGLGGAAEDVGLGAALGRSGCVGEAELPSEKLRVRWWPWLGGG